jgi:hypothetical protein
MEVEETAAEEGAGGKGFVAQEREERNQNPSGRFYRRERATTTPLRGRPREREREQPSPTQVKNSKRQLPPIPAPAARTH